MALPRCREVTKRLEEVLEETLTVCGVAHWLRFHSREKWKAKPSCDIKDRLSMALAKGICSRCLGITASKCLDMIHSNGPRDSRFARDASDLSCKCFGKGKAFHKVHESHAKSVKKKTTNIYNPFYFAKLRRGKANAGHEVEPKKRSRAADIAGYCRLLDAFGLRDAKRPHSPAGNK